MANYIERRHAPAQLTTIWDRVDSFATALEKKVSSEGSLAIYKIGEGYKTLTLPPLGEKGVHKSLSASDLRWEGKKLLSLLRPNFLGHRDELDELRSDIYSDINSIKGRELQKLQPRHLIHDYAMRGRFKNPRERLFHRRAYKVACYVIPRLSTLKQKARNSSGVTQITHCTFTAKVLSSGEVWLDQGKIGEGAYKTVKVFQELISGYKCVSAEVRPDLSRRDREISRDMMKLEKRVYSHFRNAPGIAKLMPEGNILKTPGLLLKLYPLDLSKALRSDSRFLTKSKQKEVALTLGTGLYHMHQDGYYHLDIKPANTLLRFLDGKQHPVDAVLADMGCVQVNPREKDLEGFCGTVLYAPPETSNIDRGSRAYHDLKAKVESSEPKSYRLGDPIARFLFQKRDVWALGLMLYEMRYKQLPRWIPSSSRSPAAFLNTVGKLTRGRQAASGYVKPSAGTYEYIIWKMLDPDPETRLSSSRLCQELENVGKAKAAPARYVEVGKKWNHHKPSPPRATEPGAGHFPMRRHHNYPPFRIA